MRGWALAGLIVERTIEGLTAQTTYMVYLLPAAVIPMRRRSLLVDTCAPVLHTGRAYRASSG